MKNVYLALAIVGAVVPYLFFFQFFAASGIFQDGRSNPAHARLVFGQGFRLGGVNDPLNTGICNADDITTFGPFQKYDDETMWNYEVGMKSSWDNGVTFNAAAFYADIDDNVTVICQG